MSFQSLNIIGSFTAGTSSVQLQQASDRDRAEAYRSLLRDQVRVRRSQDPDAENPIGLGDSEDRLTIGDAPEGNRSPYFSRQNQDGDQAPSSDTDPNHTDDESPETGHLDTVI